MRMERLVRSRSKESEARFSERHAQYDKVTSLFLRAINGRHPCENIVFSPLSIITLLSIAADATTGSASQEITAFLHGKEGSAKTCALLKELRENIEGSPGLTSANAVAVKKELEKKIVPEFKKKLTQDYDGQLILSRDILYDANRWVKKKTKNRIHQIVDESEKDMPALLLNAITFDARWKTPYTERDIRDREFTDVKGIKNAVPMLHSMETSYLEDGAFTGFVKPYAGDEFDFLALLPKENGPRALQQALSGLNLTSLYQDSKPERVFVSMPGFRCTFGADLTGMCQTFGIHTIFTEDADFSPLAREWLKMGAIIHQSHIEVDRKGTRAAAVTIGEVLAGCAPSFDYKVIDLDRPFVYAVVHRKTRLPVFVGITNRCEGRFRY